MTIAAGFVCSDGIILAADTQETIVGYTKNSTEKIRIWGDQGLGIAITGAGDTDLIETIGPEIERALYVDYAPKEVRFPEDVKAIIQNTMADSFTKYIRPYASFPKDDRPWCELLVAVSVKNEVNEYECLFKVAGTTAREVTFGAECIGSGLILAKSLIERFYNSFMSMDEALLAACYIMHQTKKWVDGCGGNTDLLISSVRKHNIFTTIGSRDIERVEEQFEICEEPINTLIVALLNPNRDPQFIKKLTSVAAKHSSKALKEIYPSHSRLGEILKRFNPTKPSGSRKSKDQQ